MDIKISVIIPVYKVEKYINQCVDSVLNQTYKNIEIILVDDGSPDNCPKICDDYAKLDNRIKVIHKKNGGLSSARNYGIKQVTGDYVIFLDSDDWWNDSNFIKDVVNKKLFDLPDVVIFGYLKYFETDNSFVPIINTNINIVSNDKAEQIKDLVVNDVYESEAWNKFIKADIFKQGDMYFTEGIFSEDIDWSARLLIKAKTFKVFEKDIYVYRQNMKSITHTISKKNIIDLKNNIKCIVDMSNDIKNEKYYEYYMSYCAYQYITFLNNICKLKSKEIETEMKEMKEYAWLLDYHTNQKVEKIHKFNKLFGYYGTIKVLKLYLKLRG